MPVLGFSPQFAVLVESGAKRQTIRAPRKRPIVVGDRLYLYTGMRTKACRKLGEGIVERVELIRIALPLDVAREGAARVYLREIQLSRQQAYQLASDDGFPAPNALGRLGHFFQHAHGLPFTGSLIRWRLLPREEWRKP